MRFFIGGIMSNIEQQLAELPQSTLDRLKEIHHEGEKELQDLRVSVLGFYDVLYLVKIKKQTRKIAEGSTGVRQGDADKV